MKLSFPALTAASLAMCAIAVPAAAEPGDTATQSGTTSAEIIEPGAITRLDDLRFAAFASPTAAATMTITADGVVSATGEVATTMNAFTSPGGRGPARFRIQGTDNRAFVPFFPRSVTITNGTSTMMVDKMSDNIRGRAILDEDGRYIYQIGGTLNVNANQEPGNYRGEFTVTVLFN
ncbi:DUF4402 domain-containing protein [Aurantiacibacter rhizosphaerae]|uniref:DUF4402 domain-containing protein n=1 Tax=Aurantiacibacter rhizosphaerae TaxID=2691582 RepID=A0A844XAC4_9SPHN|nr:DUF4402 domain-containing protein [Aurantiacibacter rhizosphaerae]MWV26588.1 DUF4402 domain-containing protein [Aurantiacibacter rhizosphaerae]